MKKTGGTDFLRFGENINKREQDGIKLELLCDECELRLSVWEKTFSEICFIPATKGEYPNCHYSEWLSKFLASVVWRTGVWRKESGDFDEYDPELQDLIDIALENWRMFLLGKIGNPGKNELHLLPIGDFHQIEGPRIPSNWNRYTKRYIEYDFVQTESKKFAAIFVKMGPVAVFGHITNRSDKWIGTRVAVQHGSFVIKAKLLDSILDYLIDRAAIGKELFKNLSPNQRNKINENLYRNLDRVAESDLFTELDADVKRFGKSALDEH